jgi:DNA polymerase-3 subunit epsilon
MAIKGKKYAIIDIETTGGLIKRDKITEIAIVLHDGKQILERFESLVNPERSIPEYVSRITGITDEMVADAPKFYEVARQIVEMTEGAVFVAHNARFDYSFIREEFQRLGYTYSRKQLCTVRLAKQVFPDLRRYGLDALIRHFGIAVQNRHRAMGDTMATVELFEHILGEQESEERINSVLNLGIRESRLPPNISLEFLHNLPEETGVYYFHDVSGSVIYVGKSINIRSRVMQHFGEISNKAAKLQRSVHDITYEITGSELAALLLENHEIKKYKPQVNHAQKRDAYPFALYVAEDDTGYLNLHIQKVHRIPDPGSQVLQEYTSRSAAKSHLRALVKEFELCLNKTELSTGPGACFDRQIHQCHGACIDEEAPGEYNDRVLDVIASVSHRLKESCLIVDHGRHHEERTIIAVEDGHFRGFGYLDGGKPLTRLEEALDHVTPYPATPESMKIIHSYVASGKAERIVKW